MSDKKKFRARHAIVLITLLLVLGGLLYYREHKPEQAGHGFREITIQRGTVEISILATGTVQPENRVDVKAPINGRIETSYVKEGDIVTKGSRIALMSSTERAALIDAATARGPKELKIWQGLYPPTPILAPITGTIIQRNIEVGQSFSSSDAIYVMSDRLTVKAQVDETDIAQIQIKQKATLTLDAYAEHSLSATVDQIAFDARTVNNVTTYDVDVLPDNTPPFMRSGMTANVVFHIDVHENVLTVPVEAVTKREGKFYVRVRNGLSVGEKEFEAGITDGKVFEVKSGLSENEIVLAPEFKIDGKGPKGGSPFAPGSPRGRRGQ